MKTRIVCGLLLLPFLALSTVAADATNNAGKLPKVLIIGDSISEGYTPVVKEKLKEIAEVSRPDENCQYSGYGLKKIKAWVGTEKWDVIHFNFGIWDVTRATPEEYRGNLSKIVTLLEGTGAKLVWASTTPLLPRTDKKFKDVIHFNSVAASVMQAHKIPIDDLYNLVMPNVKTWQKEDGTHYVPVGYDQLGKQVADTIQKTLTAPKPK